MIDNLLRKQQRLLLTLAVSAAVAGLLCWFLMPRQEDPSFPNRNGLIILTFPGADATTLEEQVVKPLEEELASVDDIRRIHATARTNVAIVSVQLSDKIYDVVPVWDEVEDALAQAQRQFPEGVLPPETDWKLTELHTVVVAITGSDDRIALSDAADRLGEKLLTLPNVSGIDLISDPKRQITVAFDEDAVRSFGIRSEDLVNTLQSRTHIIPGGSLRVGGRTLTVDSGSAIDALEQLKRTPILLPTGTAIELRELATVRLSPKEPMDDMMRINGVTAVGVGIKARKGIDSVVFGKDVADVIETSRASLEPLQIEMVTFQPDYVEARLADLGGSLLLGIAIVALVLILTMGLRLGMVVSMVVPLVTFTSLAVYASVGGILHQISIAALVLSLGLLVDNAIVIAERIQWRIDRGEDNITASIKSVRELFLPLLAATGTTMASFVPLLLSSGVSADFTRAIPVLVILTLGVSFIFAVLITPTMAAIAFKPSPPDRQTFRLEHLGAHLGQLAARRPVVVVVTALIMVSGAISLVPQLKQQFFPSGDRDQVVFEIELAQGSHLSETNAATVLVERALLKHPDVEGVSTFVGRGTPPFYYNLLRRPQSPHVAQLLVDLKNDDASLRAARMVQWGRDFAARTLPGVVFVARKLEQGPPVQAPVEIRVYAQDRAEQAALVQQVYTILQNEQDVRDLRHTMSLGSPVLALELDDASAARRGLSRRDLALTVLGRTRGLDAGTLWRGDEPIPIKVRSSAGEKLRVDELLALNIAFGRSDTMVPLETVARAHFELRPAEIHRRNRRRVAAVRAELAPGASFATVLSSIQPQLETLFQDREASWEFGGAAEGSGKANSAIFIAAPIGAILLLLVLLAQFRSFRRVGMVLLTVPLAAAGVVPGLLIADQPFGFTSLLGVFALIGIVVNNAIILIDFIDLEIAQGTPLQDALRAGVEVRLRPIVLTTVTTIIGLLPLLFSSSPLWPPLASSLISGLIGSTLLTLFVVPATYRLLIRDNVNTPVKV